MEGGIRAWKGLVAEGIPEAGMAYFSPATRPEEMIALAWLLEDGSLQILRIACQNDGGPRGKGALSKS